MNLRKVVNWIVMESYISRIYKKTANCINLGELKRTAIVEAITAYAMYEI
jgi:hypothetical protein